MQTMNHIEGCPFPDSKCVICDYRGPILRSESEYYLYCRQLDKEVICPIRPESRGI